MRTRSGMAVMASFRLEESGRRSGARGPGTVKTGPSARLVSPSYLNMPRNWSTFALVTIVTGTLMMGSTLSPFFSLASASTGRLAFAGRVLLHHGGDPALVDALHRLGGEVPAEDLTSLCRPWLSTAETEPISAGSPVA